MWKKFLLIIIITFSVFVIRFLLEKSHFINTKVFSLITLLNPIDSRVNTESIKTISEPWKDPRGVFPIFAYNIPSKTSNLMASLRIIEKGGINIIINGNFGWMPDPLKLKETFMNLKNSNLKWLAIIENECKDDFIFNNWNDEKNKYLVNYLNLFNEDFVYGWYIWDEPGKNRQWCSPFNLVPNYDFEDINSMVKQIRSNSKFNSKLDFINLFPTYWDGTPDKEAYEKYVDAFFASQEYQPRVLCFDHYPFLKPESGGFRNDYYLNLEIIRNKSLQYNVPFWMIVLSSGHNDYINPSFEEIRFQVFSALAYGAKGIGYYLYSKSFEQIGYRSWILENYVDNESVNDSLYGPLYLPVKNLNVQIQNLGAFLLDYKSVKVIHTTDFPNFQKHISIGFPDSLKKTFFIDSILYNGKNSQADLLIGFFEKGNNSNEKVLLIVNKNFKENINVDLKFEKNSSVKKLDKNSGRIEKIDTDNFCYINLEGGEGDLFLLSNN